MPKQKMEMGRGFGLFSTPKKAGASRGFTPKKAGASPRKGALLPRGFTLIELLVVIALIGIIAALAMIALGAARQKSRDSRRLSDLKQIQSALELFYDGNNGYPATTSILLADNNHSCLSTSGFLPAGSCTTTLLDFPKDPAGGYYYYSSSGDDYVVLTSLEGVMDDLTGTVAINKNRGAFNTGLTGWWRLDEKGGDMVVDSTNNANNGILVNSPVWDSGVRDGSLFFNGINQTVSIPYSTAINPPRVTISAWVKPDIAALASLSEIIRKDAPNMMLLSFQDSAHCSGGGGTAGCLSFGITHGGVYDELDVNINLIDYADQWVNILASYDGVTRKLYRNGVLIGQDVVTGSTITPGEAIYYIGSRLGTAEFFKGNIDDVRIYNRALNPDEILSLYRE